MKVINDQLNDLLLEMAKKDPAISQALYDSNVETFDYGIHNRNRYKKVFNTCLETMQNKIKEGFAEQGKSFDYDLLICDELGDVIASNMPSFTNALFEMTLDNDFNHRVEVDYEMPKDDLSIHARSFLDESLREELKDELDDFWQDLKDQPEEEE